MMKAELRYSGRAAAHSQIVDRSIDGQRADIAAREEDRLDHVRVRGESKPGSCDV